MKCTFELVNFYLFITAEKGIKAKCLNGMNGTCLSCLGRGMDEMGL